jgi:protein TonB
MFNNLIESNAAKQKQAMGFFTSFVLHVVIIGGAVWATYGVTEAMDRVKEEKIDFVQVKKDEPPPPKEEPKPPPPDVVAAPPPPKGFQILTAPIKIPDVLPDIDLSKSVTREEDFTGKGAAGGTAKGVVGGTPQPINNDQPYFEFQVEQQVRPDPKNTAPNYPSQLRSANVEGQVLAQFVVDTTGRADMSTFKSLSSAHDLFTAAVKNHLPSMRFIPAEVGGRKVKQLVQMPFLFTLSR